jgi:uncharacterized protein YecE (DUF72 family)
MPQAGKTGEIRVGIGGWTFEPWRGTFYPKGLAHAKELAYASSKLTTIEINGTFYRTQTPATFAKWSKEVPDGFVFSVKGPRYVVQKRVLAEAGEALGFFLKSGITELGDRLGPILWQFAPTKKFDAADFAAFLAMLPAKLDGLRLRHAVEVRHPSFATPQFIALLRQHQTPVVFAEHDTYPGIADLTGDFIYARLQQGDDAIATGYPLKALDAWAKRARAWAAGSAPDDLPSIANKPAKKAARDVFVYVIHEGKIRAPAAAMALIERLGGEASSARAGAARRAPR